MKRERDQLYPRSKQGQSEEEASLIKFNGSRSCVKGQSSTCRSLFCRRILEDHTFPRYIIEHQLTSGSDDALVISLIRETASDERTSRLGATILGGRRPIPRFPAHHSRVCQRRQIICISRHSARIRRIHDVHIPGAKDRLRDNDWIGLQTKVYPHVMCLHDDVSHYKNTGMSTHVSAKML